LVRNLSGFIWKVRFTLLRLKRKKFKAVVQVDAAKREIKECDVQPKSEEGFFVSFSPKLLLTVVIISVIVNSGLCFGLKMFEL